MELNGVSKIIVIMLIIRVVGVLLKKSGKKNKNSKIIKSSMNQTIKRSREDNSRNKREQNNSIRKEVRNTNSNINMGFKKSLLSKDTKPNRQMSPLDRMAMRERELERKNR